VGGRLIIRRGQASGDSVGITAQGTFQLDTDEICLAGAVTPAYVLNAFLSNVPIIGWILTGGEGRGLFAVNYAVHGPIDNPKGDINVATAITPGFLRRMMEGTCGVVGGATTPAAAPAPAGATAPAGAPAPVPAGTPAPVGAPVPVGTTAPAGAPAPADAKAPAASPPRRRTLEEQQQDRIGH
jgi:hypothetical protein